jgi:hypothetical protein
MNAAAAVPPPVTFARCSACARTYGREAWLALPLDETLTSQTVSSHVLAWPEGAAIEVRRCNGCGRRIARKAVH